MKSKKILGFILTGVMITGIFPQQSLANSDYIVSRVQGSNRYQTSANISQSILNKHDKVILASGENFADALSAGNYGAEATILLTQKDKIPSYVKKEINRLNPSEIIIVGGESSISKSVERELQGRTVNRISGKDRYETSSKIASEFSDKNNGFVLANGTNFADALAATPYTVQKNQTLVLTNGKSLPEGISKDDVVAIIGGKQSVNIEDLENVERISGKDRYETAIEVAKHFSDTFSIVIADGKNYPDALSASPLAISKGTAILLSDISKVNKIKPFIDKSGAENLIFIGGESSISNLQVQNLTGLTPMEIAIHESMGIPRSKAERLKPYSEKDIDLSNFDIDTPLSEDEKELVRLVNEYRVSKGLNPMAVSKSLTFVSRTHCKDQILNYKRDWTDERGIPANLHSWSDKGDWTPVMYTADHEYASGMWDKPSELTPYKSSGYEISFSGSFATPSLALTGWQNSPAHNDVLIGTGFWKDLTIMGVSIHDGFSNIWFGTDEDDPAGFHMTIENNN